VGEGKLEGQLIAEAKAAGCFDKSIRFLGSVPRGQVNDFFRASGASIMTMAQTEILYRHSVQNKFFDSLAAGRAVFANYRGWASELAESEGVGEILSVDDVVDAARKVHERMTDANWLERSGGLAQKLAEERFSFDLLAAKLERTLSDAAAASR
jgi:glycosyltransferase involved in cell wall biosynthesis